MIPLAQYLSEIGTPDAAAGGRRGNVSPLRRQPAFERLTLVESRPARPEPAFRPLVGGDEDEVVMDASAFEPLGGGFAGFEGFGEAGGEDDDFGLGAALAEPDAPTVGDDPEALLAAARAEGEAAGRAAARAEAEAEFAAERAAIEARFAAEREEALAEARATWASAEGERLAGLLSTQADRIGMVLRESFGSVLKPLARSARERQTVAEMVEAVALLAGDGKALAMRASGPRDLLDALRRALPPRQGALVAFVEEREAVELRLQADATVIETRLTDWRRALGEVLS